MKLIACLNCWNIFSLDGTSKKLVQCPCGASKGRYEHPEEEKRHEQPTEPDWEPSGVYAIYEGVHAIPIGVKNVSLSKAIQRQGMRHQYFDAYVVPERNDLFRPVKNLTETSYEEINPGDDDEHQKVA